MNPLSYLQLKPTFCKLDDLDFSAFRTLCEQEADKKRYTSADCIEHNVVCYQAATISESNWRVVQNEIAHALLEGPGVVAIHGFYSNPDVIDDMNRVFEQILQSEQVAGFGANFAQSGVSTNQRIWNTLQKSAYVDANAFLNYYKNPMIKLVAESWLGPHYEITTQVNTVPPGGKAQEPHRDYHLCFKHDNELVHYPVHVQQMSAMLTLQGAVAHTDMPLESGPTLLLPFSQQYPLGYIGCRNKKFRRYFHENAIQLPLKKGDALFFNPALIHAAGENHTQNFYRTANLFQISSVFGKPMETIDHAGLCRTLYALLQNDWITEKWDPVEKECLITAIADSYAFPTNLDKEVTEYEMAPESMAQLLEKALNNNWTQDQFDKALDGQINRRSA